MIDGNDLPVDPDWSDVPEELALLAHLNHGIATLTSEDGVGPAVVVVAPAVFAHARRLSEPQED